MWKQNFPRWLKEGQFDKMFGKKWVKNHLWPLIDDTKDGLDLA